jgi:hypothetical protein
MQHSAPLAMPVGQGAHEVPLAGPASPPHVASTHEITDVDYVDDEAPAAETIGRPPSSRRNQWLLLLLLLVSCGMFLLAATAVGYVLVRRQQGDANSPSSDEPFWESIGPSTRNVEWTQAPGNSVRAGPARVEVVRAEIGEARGKDAAGNVIISDGDFLQILIRIENNTPLPLEYRSWYGNDFANPGESQPLRVKLTDDEQRTYAWVLFDDVERVRWHTPQATILPRKTVEDVIIFELPPGATKEKLKYVRLELPAAAVGYRAGYYRFEIPRSMIEGLGD